MLDEITATYEAFAREIAKREHLLVVIPKDEAPSTRLSPLTSHLLPLRSNDTWARDHGFITLSDDEGHLRLLDFRFNGWGEKFPADLDNAINRHLYDEGMITTGCLLAPHRNQPMTKEQIEERLKRELHAKRILWIDHGNLTGDDTDGHIDTLVRICPEDTLLYVGCDDPKDEQYEDLRLMEEQLKTFRTLDGKPYRLKRLPMPRPIYEDGDRLPATYANFLVINGAVLCPTYAQPDLDTEALRIIGEAFPGREIVGIDCRSVIRQHGSLHCCTMQIPEK